MPSASTITGSGERDAGLHQLDGRSSGEADAEHGDGLPGACHGRHEVERGCPDALAGEGRGDDRAVVELECRRAGSESDRDRRELHLDGTRRCGRDRNARAGVGDEREHAGRLDGDGVDPHGRRSSHWST